MTTATSKAADETRIRALIEKRASALRVKDAQGVLSCRTADSLHFSLAPPLRSETDVARLNAWFSTWEGGIGLEVRGLAVTAAGEVAFCHGLTHMTGRKVDGAQVDLWFRTTLGLRKEGGAWRIAHEHESVPFYMDGSFKAAIDLQP